MLRVITLTIFMVMYSGTLYASSPVWQVSKGSNIVYVAGTVHVLAQSDYPLPKAFEQAYQKANTLVFETDMSQMETPSFQKELITKMLFHDGRTYADVLKPDTVNQLSEYFVAKGIPAGQLQVFKPAMLAINLTMIELQSLGLADAGVDEFYRQKGLKDKKSFLFLETPLEQLDFLANMGKGYEDEMIEYTLNDIATIKANMDELKSAWRIGDNDQLYQSGAKEMKDLFPSTYQQMIVDRNNNWLPHIEKYLSSSETELVLVGALHLVGKDGVLNLLEDKGYTVIQMP